MVEIDDVGSTPSGMHSTANCYLATTSAFTTTSTLSGQSFAFGMQGENSSGTPKAYVGRMTFSTESANGGTGGAAGGSITNGFIDGMRVDQTGDNGGAFSTNSSYTMPDSNGRFTFTMIPTGQTSGQTFIAYIIDANRMFMLETAGDTGLLVGDMRTQLQSLNSAATLLNGSFVLYNQGYEYSNGNVSGYLSQVYQGTGDGTGSITMNQSYEDVNGVYSSGQDLGTATPSLDASYPGRASFSGNGSTYLYFFNNTSAFELNLSSGFLDSGWMEAQSGTFTDTAVAGTYMMGELPLIEEQKNGNVGDFDLLANGSGTANVTTAGIGSFAYDQSIGVGTYAWDTTASGTGSFLVGSGSKGISCVVVNQTKDACIFNGDDRPSLMILQQ
jgi:hypothetical protein